MQTIINKIRDLIQDNLKYNTEIQEYYGISKVFTLQNANISDLKVYRLPEETTPWDIANYTPDLESGIVTVDEESEEELEVGDKLKFTYDAYEKYSDTELEGYVRSALYYLTIEKYATFVIISGDTIDPEPTIAEESLIAIIASILIKGSIRQYRTPEITITFGEDMSVEKKIKLAIRQFSKTYGVISFIDPNEVIEE